MAGFILGGGLLLFFIVYSHEKRFLSSYMPAGSPYKNSPVFPEFYKALHFVRLI